MSEKNHYHFIGVCGTAMGSVAAAMKRNGFTVTGSDENIYPPMSTFLEKSGVGILPGYKAGNIPDSAEVIVVGNAIEKNPGLIKAFCDTRDSLNSAQATAT
jgi:UDP-N-acetylmuramate: L-alanyl-gamma-D-glutamyl-meso-diaminopimelate ligase